MPLVYQVKEVFYTLQGEGARSGRAAVFCRFAGCNLWSGRERDRSGATCDFCDTDFRGTDGPGGGRFADPDALAEHILQHWPSRSELEAGGEPSASRVPAAARCSSGGDACADTVAGGPHDEPPSQRRQTGSEGRRYVVCTGGEPLLQLDAALITALHARDFEIAVETNGTRPAPAGIDWLCVSPKASAPLACRSGNELKLVFPQPEAPPERFASLDFEHFFLQPMDGPRLAESTAQVVDYCKRHPQWRLSLQIHKLLGIP